MARRLGRALFPSIIVQKQTSCLYSNPSSSPSKAFDLDISRIRNIGIMAHVDAGKTTTTERMLFYAGYTQRIGDVDDGSTVTDFLEAERNRGITITSACIPFAWSDHRINLIDTPGHIDFTMEVERAVRVLDGAICLLDGVAGVEAQTENVWKQANAYSVPRIAFVNKMDREGSSFSKTLKSMRGRLRGWGRPLVLQWPVVLDQPPISVQAGTGGSDLDGIVDLLNLEVLDWKADQECGDTVTRTPLETFCQSHPDIGPTLLETSKQARIELVESLSELDEEIVDVYLSNDADHLAVPAKDIQAALRRVTLSGKGVPVLCGAAFKNFGVQPLLDAVVHYLPSPRDRPIPNAVDPKGQKVPIPIDDAKPCALAFKVTHDERRGPLVFVRVYSGTFDSRSVLNNTTQNVKECATKCLQMYADEYEEIPHLSAGNIAALSGLKVTKTGDTLLHSSDKRAISLFPIPIPPPVFVRSVEALSQSDESKLEAALASLVREDPSVSVQVDPETGQTLLSGMGELHIDIVSERLLEQYKVKCKMGPVSIAYRESLFGVDLSQDVLYEKESLGKKTKLGIQLTITNVHKEEDSEGLLPVLLEPNQIKVELNTSNVFIGTRNLKEQSLSQLPSGYPSLSEIQDALKAGVHNALNRGPLARYPLTNLIVQIKRVALYGHDLCSKGAVRVAVYQLIQGLLKNLNLQLFEPMMKVKLRVPDKYTGQVTKDLSGHRRGHIQSLVPESEEDTTQHSICLIEAHVPLSEMLGYAVHLRSTTAGNASFTMELCGFGVIQGERQDQVLKQLRGY